MPDVLVVDDDPALLDVLVLAFEDAGHQVARAVDGRDALAAIERAAPDVIVCDVVMPRLDGLALVRTLRERGDDTPILMLTSRDSEMDEALGLELGADDYVTKPFSTRVLLARVAALVRRHDALRGGRPTVAPRKLGTLELDDERMQVRWRHETIATTLTEFRLLDVLTRRPGAVCSRDALLERMRGDGTVVAPRIIDTYVNRLRRKLEAVDPAFDRIETVIGVGYRWKDDP